MKRRLPRYLLIYGGLFGLILGCLISAGFLIAPRPQAQRAERRAGRGEEPVAMGGYGAVGPVAPIPMTARRPSSTWTLLGRIATAQLEEGQVEQSQQTMALIPDREEAEDPVNRTLRDEANDALLSSFLHSYRGPRNPEASKVHLQRAEAVALRSSAGAARAGAWLEIYEYTKQIEASERSDLDRQRYLSKSAAEASKISVDRAPPGSAPSPGVWDRVGGELLLIWPLGLTVLGSLGAEMIRKFVEFFGEDLGESAAGWLGTHRQPAEVGGPGEPATTVAATTVADRRPPPA